MESEGRNEPLDPCRGPAKSETAGQQNPIRLSKSAWEDFVRLTSAAIPAAPVARREAREFLRRFRG